MPKNFYFFGLLLGLFIFGAFNAKIQAAGELYCFRYR